MSRMKTCVDVVLCACLVATLAGGTSGHGYLFEPPSRASMWRTPQYRNKPPINYDDMGNNCGGYNYQHSLHGGKCGLCGDPYSGERRHEAGGKYANGIITRSYQPGDIMNASVVVTADHKGYFQFKVCPHDDVTTPATEACINQHVLQDASGADRFYLGHQKGRHDIRLLLPHNLRCRTQCVFVWIWTTGNNWGVCANGTTSGMGCGPQENFRGCADITIWDDVTPSSDTTTEAATTTHTTTPSTTTSSTSTTSTTTTPTTTPSTTTPPTTTPSTTTASTTTTHRSTSTDASTSTTTTTQKTSTDPTLSSTSTTTTSTTVATTGRQVCRGVGLWATEEMKKWCDASCNHNPPYCPATHCSCHDPSSPEGPEVTTTAAPELVCKSVGAWAGDETMTAWCDNMCIRHDYCPDSYCRCHYVNVPPPARPLCRAVDARTSDGWCDANCNHVPSFCPPKLCTCSGGL